MGRAWIAAMLVAAAGAGCREDAGGPKEATMGGDTVKKTDSEWATCLTKEQYRILREKGTEAAFTGAFYDEHRTGTYVCAACGSTLFESADKFDSGTGWPSYTRPAAADAVAEHADDSHGMHRTEVVCARCGGHLGHVFDDGPPPTGLRFCINSAALKFIPADTRTGTGGAR